MYVQDLKGKGDADDLGTVELLDLARDQISLISGAQSLHVIVSVKTCLIPIARRVCST